jgi:hypothetical protein
LAYPASKLAWKITTNSTLLVVTLGKQPKKALPKNGETNSSKNNGTPVSARRFPAFFGEVVGQMQTAHKRAT